MRILLVIDSLTGGGTERSVADLAGGLRQVGVDVSFVQLIERGGYSDHLRADGFEVLSVGSGTRAGRIIELRSILRQRRPDLVHTQLFEADITGRIAARAAGLPVVSSLVSIVYGEAHRQTPGIRRHRLAAAQATDVVTARLVRRFHAVSQVVARAMAVRLHVSAAKVDVVPRGRAADALGRRSLERSTAVRSSLGLALTDPILLAVGRHEWQKGFDVLLEALRLHRPPGSRAAVLIAGREGNATADLRAAAAWINPDQWDVRFLGPRDDVADLMVAADVLVSPSRWEGLPGTLIEALALEVPIIATDIEPSLEVIERLPGVRVVEEGSAGALGAAIAASLADPPDTAGHRARFEDRYDLEAVARSMRAFYERALG